MPDVNSFVQPRFRLAIVGGGIAGLTLAVALGRKEDPSSPIQIDLYESDSEITEVGAGVTVWSRTWAVLRELGVYDELANKAVKTAESKDYSSSALSGGGDGLKTGFVFRKSDSPCEGFEWARVMVPNGSTTMHRADMVDVLIRHLPSSCTIHTSKRLVGYTEPEHPGGGVYTLHFADGSMAEADVIVGADGIRSQTRTSMYDYEHARECLGGKGGEGKGPTKDECERCSRANPKWVGTVAYRYLIPTDKLRDVNPRHHAVELKVPISYSGKRKHIITYPISSKYLNWIGFVTTPGAEGTPYPHKWATDGSREELVSHFAGWEPEVDEMISCVDKPTMWAIHHVDNLPFSVSGRVALMGDSVHAMTTHFGAGGGQAIEDAYILGFLLGNPNTTLSLVADVLAIYQDVRLPFAHNVVQNAHNAGLMYEFNCPGLYDGVDAGMEDTKARLAELEGAIQEIWKWQWEELVQDQWKEAERSLSELVGSRDGKAAMEQEIC